MHGRIHKVALNLTNGILCLCRACLLWRLEKCLLWLTFISGCQKHMLCSNRMLKSPILIAVAFIYVKHCHCMSFMTTPWHCAYMTRRNRENPLHIKSSSPDKMDTISQTAFWNAFSSMIFVFDSNFTAVCYKVSNWQYSSISSDNGLAPSRRQAII